jgi:hypothetical protein
VPAHTRKFRRALSLIAVLLSCCSSAELQRTAANPGRVLPLNHFDQAPTAQSHEAIRGMRIAIGDDYFDGTSSPQRVQRHFQLARRLQSRRVPDSCSFTPCRLADRICFELALGRTELHNASGLYKRRIVPLPECGDWKHW